MAARLGDLVIGAGPSALIAPPGAAQVLRLSLAAINRAQPIERYAGRLPDEAINHNLGPWSIFTDCNVGIAGRAFIAAIPRTLLVRAMALLAFCVSAHKVSTGTTAVGNPLTGLRERLANSLSRHPLPRPPSRNSLAFF